MFCQSSKQKSNLPFEQHGKIAILAVFFIFQASTLVDDVQPRFSAQLWVDGKTDKCANSVLYQKKCSSFIDIL